MRGWAIWMIRHRLVWLLKTIIVIAYPLHVLAYWDQALDDIRHTLRSIDREVNNDQH